MTFNIPVGKTAEQMVNVRKMMVAIDGTQAGETIRMSFFSLTVPNFSDKLIAAYERGVNVRLIQDDHEIGPLWQEIVAKIGSNPTKKSWAMLCHRSCHSDEYPSYMHAKLYLFSKTKGLSKVVMISSANPTFTQARIGWNDMYTVIGNATLYEGALRYFEDMTAGAIEDANGDQSTGVPIDAYFSAASGKYQAYYFPKAGEGSEEDPMWQILDDVECVGTAPGYGLLGRTVIKVAMYQWSVRRDRLAYKLWNLSQDGCWVDIIYDQTVTDKEVVDVLKTPGEGRYGIPTLTKASEDRNDDGVYDHFIHTKYVLVNGIYTGDTSTKVIFTGTANWTNTAMQYGNEIMFQIKDNSVYSDYMEQFGTMKAWAKSLKKEWLSSGPDPSILPGGEAKALSTEPGWLSNEQLPTEWE